MGTGQPAVCNGSHPVNLEQPNKGMRPGMGCLSQLSSNLGETGHLLFSMFPPCFFLSHLEREHQEWSLEKSWPQLQPLILRNAEDHKGLPVLQNGDRIGIWNQCHKEGFFFCMPLCLYPNNPVH